MARVNMPHAFDLVVGPQERIHLRKGINDVDDKHADHWVIQKFLVDNVTPPANQANGGPPNHAPVEQGPVTDLELVKGSPRTRKAK